MKQVTAAILIQDNKILIAKRPADDKIPKWEFPGGKIEDGETAEQCLQRELFEELGIYVRVGNHFCSSTYTYDFGQIELIAFFVEWLSGEIQPSAHDEVRWVLPEQLDHFDFSPADLPIVEKLKRRMLTEP
jgi:8-oxo-dGTP diphosphatase